MPGGHGVRERAPGPRELHEPLDAQRAAEPRELPPRRRLRDPRGEVQGPVLRRERGGDPRNSLHPDRKSDGRKRLQKVHY